MSTVPNKFSEISDKVIDLLSEELNPAESVFLLTVTASQLAAFAGINPHLLVETFYKSFSALAPLPEGKS